MYGQNKLLNISSRPRTMHLSHSFIMAGTYSHGHGASMKRFVYNGGFDMHPQTWGEGLCGREGGVPVTSPRSDSARGSTLVRVTSAFLWGFGQKWLGPREKPATKEGKERAAVMLALLLSHVV